MEELVPPLMRFGLNKATHEAILTGCILRMAMPRRCLSVCRGPLARARSSIKALSRAARGPMPPAGKVIIEGLLEGS